MTSTGLDSSTTKAVYSTSTAGGAYAWAVLVRFHEEDFKGTSVAVAATALTISTMQNTLTASAGQSVASEIAPGRTVTGRVASMSAMQAAPTPPNENRPALSVGSKAGIGVGIVGGVLVIGGAVVGGFVIGRRRRRKEGGLEQEQVAPPYAYQRYQGQGEVSDVNLKEDGERHELGTGKEPIELHG
jgi:hypothetical protein